MLDITNKIVKYDIDFNKWTKYLLYLTSWFVSKHFNEVYKDQHWQKMLVVRFELFLGKIENETVFIFNETIFTYESVMWTGKK